MGLFNKLFNNQEDDNVVAVCSGEYVKNSDIKDKTFADELLGKTIAIEPSDGEIVSPISGTIEVLFPTKHAFAVRGKDGTGYLVHVGIDTVNLNGEGFESLKNQGDKVKAGETVLKVDLNKVKEKCPVTTMLIVSEPVDNKLYNFIDFETIQKGQVISN